MLYAATIPFIRVWRAVSFQQNSQAPACSLHAAQTDEEAGRKIPATGGSPRRAPEQPSGCAVCLPTAPNQSLLAGALIGPADPIAGRIAAVSFHRLSRYFAAWRSARCRRWSTRELWHRVIPPHRVSTGNER